MKNIARRTVPLFEDNGALLSPCKKYRYQLWRIWDKERPKVLFIMLNPSTADAEKDDPTIRRCIQYARDWGYGGIYVGNLFAYRSTDPDQLKKVDDPVGPENNHHIMMMTLKCVLIVAAWGAKGPGIANDSLRDIPLHYFHYLDISKNGQPKHPLYLPKYLKPLPLYKN